MDGPDNLDLNLEAMREAIEEAKRQEDAEKLRKALEENS